MNFTLSEQEKQERFRNLQAQLRQHWLATEDFERNCQNLLVVPSISLDPEEAKKIGDIYYFEERLLFYLSYLRNPSLRLIYLTSKPLPPSIINYYLRLLVEIPSLDECKRLMLLSLDDLSSKPLTQKILERPYLIEQIRQELRSENSYMVCYNSTDLERDLSLRLDIPLFALDPDLIHWGTKIGSRQIFAECGVLYPEGSELVRNEQELASAIATLWERNPNARKMIVKLNEGLSGNGNALLNLNSLETVAPNFNSHFERVKIIYESFKSLRFQAIGETWESYNSRLKDSGAIVEIFIEGQQKLSPSIQGCITPNGQVKLLSSHEQILGGPDSQTFVGSYFPANPIFSIPLQELGLKIGNNLAGKGVMGDFSVDFIAVSHPDSDGKLQWDFQCLEINLRKGGTTHSFQLLESLTKGRYDFASGLFLNEKGTQKYYVSFDKIKERKYQGLDPQTLINAIAHHGLEFDRNSETGCVFYLLSGLSEVGRLGFLAIGNSPLEAEEKCSRVMEILNLLTQAGND